MATVSGKARYKLWECIDVFTACRKYGHCFENIPQNCLSMSLQLVYLLAPRVPRGQMRGLSNIFTECPENCVEYHMNIY